MAKIPKRRKMKIYPGIPPNFCVTHAKEIEAIFREAVRDALRVHKALGNPVAGIKNGKVVLIQPEDIPVD